MFERIKKKAKKGMIWFYEKGIPVITSASSMSKEISSAVKTGMELKGLFFDHQHQSIPETVQEGYAEKRTYHSSGISYVVSAHPRKLSESRHPSAEKLRTAAENGFTELPPNATWVISHKKGGD